ncbi:MAG: glutamine-hydrolyzing GMP synthase, partial [Porphyromonadaceae bacterium]|nr:glutamine-hydrolyzing GMP synthase [Porphyromonadaceae bacterium]
MQEKILILDFGSQTTQLIGRRIRDLNTYCEIVPYNKLPQSLEGVKGIILSGSPYSVYDEKAFKIDISAIRGKLPLLGICYGAQSLVHQAGGKVEPAESREYGRAALHSCDSQDPLMKGIDQHSVVWMSHGDTITKLPEGFEVIASTEDVPNAAFRIPNEQTWGVQFHPEAHHSEQGKILLGNFIDI